MSVFQQMFRRQPEWRKLWLRVQHNRALMLGLSLLFLVILLHTFCFYGFEHAKNSKITLFDSFWVTLTTITTVGYGDLSASTIGGRWSTILLGYVLGLSLFAWVGSELVSRLLERMLNRKRGIVKKMRLEDHFLIINFPSKEKVRLLIERLRASEETSLTPIVVVTDVLDMLPFEYSQVRFVRGSVTNPETYKRSGIDKASNAIVLAMDHEDPSSDAITAAAVSIIEALNPDVKTVAECVYEEHLTLFRHVQCDHIVSAGDMLIRLLVQETQDSGAARAISSLLDSEGNDLYSVAVGSNASGKTFREILWGLVASDERVLPVGYQRGQDLELNPPKDTKLREDDMLLFLANNRPSWNTLPSSYFSQK